jgi:hypothetical protein
MKKNYIKFLAIIAILSFGNLNAQTEIATEVIIINGEAYGTNASNIASYDLITKTYEVFDTIGSNSIQDVLIEGTTAFVAAQSIIVSYDLETKTRIADVAFPGVSSNYESIFVDDNYVFVGNAYGQTDSNLYAFDKNTLAFEFAVTEASVECKGGLSLNDTLYIGQELSAVNYSDSIGSIIIANANTGQYYRTIELGTAGAGISKIYNEGNYIYAVCKGSSKVLKIEIGSDIITEISLPSFTKSLMMQGSKLYLDLNGKAGYLDLADESLALSSKDLAGVAIAYDPSNETAIYTVSDYFSYGSLIVSNDMTEDTIPIGISPEAIALVFKPNNSPITMDDSYEFLYEETVSEYQLAVLDNDTDADNETLTITTITIPNVTGATAVVDGQEIKYTRAAGIATTDYFTYTACDGSGACSTSIVHVLLKSLTSIDNIELENKITLFPNPANHFIEINVSDLTFEKVAISDVLGRVVKISKETKISLENINKGIFFAKVYTNKGSFTTKFLVK